MKSKNWKVLLSTMLLLDCSACSDDNGPAPVNDGDNGGDGGNGGAQCQADQGVFSCCSACKYVYGVCGLEVKDKQQKVLTAMECVTYCEGATDPFSLSACAMANYPYCRYSHIQDNCFDHFVKN